MTGAARGEAAATPLPVTSGSVAPPPLPPPSPARAQSLSTPELVGPGHRLHREAQVLQSALPRLKYEIILLEAPNDCVC